MPRIQEVTLRLLRGKPCVGEILPEMWLEILKEKCHKIHRNYFRV